VWKWRRLWNGEAGILFQVIFFYVLKPFVLLGILWHDIVFFFKELCDKRKGMWRPKTLEEFARDKTGFCSPVSGISCGVFFCRIFLGHSVVVFIASSVFHQNRRSS